MVAAVSATPNPKASSQVANQNPRRPPLLPSEAENGVFSPRRQKSREVTSWHLSSTPSSSTNHNNLFFELVFLEAASVAARFEKGVWNPHAVAIGEAEAAGDAAAEYAWKFGEMSEAAKLLVSSTRSLSVSFQGESFSLPISRAKPAPAASNMSSVRRGTAERRKMAPLRD